MGLTSSLKTTATGIKVSRAASRSFKAGRAPRPVSVRAVLVADAEKSTFLDLARENPSFSILSQAIENAGVGDALNTEGPFTMFGPTDEAFARFAEERGLSKVEVLEYLGEGVLAQLLKYHVVPGEAVYAKDLKGRATVPTIQGYNIDIEDMKMDGATVVEADVKCRNGVFHAVDSVLVPPFLMQAKLSTVPSFGLAGFKEGWAPAALNGRLAMLAWVYTIAGEVTAGESFLTQLTHHFGSAAFAVALWSFASIAPAMGSSMGYTADPTTINTTKEWRVVMKGGPWPLLAPFFTPELEKTTGLVAIGGLVGLVLVEAIKGGALLG